MSEPIKLTGNFLESKPEPVLDSFVIETIITKHRSNDSIIIDHDKTILTADAAELCETVALEIKHCIEREHHDAAILWVMLHRSMIEKHTENRGYWGNPDKGYFSHSYTKDEYTYTVYITFVNHDEWQANND